MHGGLVFSVAGGLFRWMAACGTGARGPLSVRAGGAAPLAQANQAKRVVVAGSKTWR
jgi:hypothetical protein